MRKSDDMIKSMVAQIASQGMGIFLQSRQEEHEGIEELRTDLMEARDYINSLEDKIDEMRKDIDEKVQQVTDIEVKLQAAERDNKNLNKWWMELMNENARLKRVLKDEPNEEPSEDREAL